MKLNGYELPAHLCELTLTHNPHRSNYETVDEWNADKLEHGCDLKDEWVSEEQLAKAIATQDFWTLQWYPNTPVGFCSLAAADLDELLKYAESAD